MKLKRCCIAVVLILFTGFMFAQTGKVEKIHSIKATFIGLSYGYEQPLSSRSVINFEIMLAGGLGSNIAHGDYWVVAPVIRIEPRYYYNFVKRQEKEKKTMKNSANYISLSVDWQLQESIDDNTRPLRTVTMIPKWGIRRIMGNHFTVEFATGVGAYKTEIDSWKSTLGLDLKLGFAF